MTDLGANALTGIVTKESPRSVPDTVTRLVDLVAAKGLKLFALIDHSGEANAVGLDLRETKVVIFGSPEAGTPVMVDAPLAALDLPLKVLVWESADGKTLLSYNSPEFLQQRHGLDAPPFEPVVGLLQLASR